ncbi:MAG TPA: LD-carboxypeptidase [Chitinophagaceae bacterium]|nr:LD-carboxypeptidase [Chitinophagaceae bacterium]
MKRKNFIQSSIGALLTASYLPAIPKISAFADEALFVAPAFLKAGDIIGITAPAGYITTEEIRSAVQKMESWGYKIQIGETIDKRDFTFGGTDEERAKDFQKMLDDPKIKAIMCARGGYGVVRIIDKLNWEKFKSKPKWIIGFSDVTVFHSHLNKNFGIVSIHSKMCNSFPDDWSLAEPIQIETIESIQLALSGKKMKYSVVPNPQNKLGTADGVLIGGNLKMLETLAGTKSDINTAGKILFVEDTGEYMYSVDRMFWNLKRTGKLSQLKGLIVGGFKIKVDEDSDDFGKTLQDVVLEKVKAWHYPVCFDFPVGHQRNNYALKCGAKHRLEINSETVSLKEI